MHRDGKLGTRAIAQKAAQRSVEVRTARASSIARRLLEEHEEEVRDTLLEIIKKGTRTEKLKALDIMVKAGLRGEQVNLNEQKIDGEQKSRDELIRSILDKMNGPAGAVIRANAAELEAPIVDAEVVG